MSARTILLIFGFLLIELGVILFVGIFLPVISEEVRYTVIRPNRAAVITPIDANFGIVIPKIGANARVIPNVDPNNAREYQYALTQGVAHAKGTALPNESGNTFLFSHSSVDFFEASKYNSIFYLLSKLENGDTVTLWYQGSQYSYTVQSKVLVDPTNLSYLTRQSTKRQVTLMTCWPPGTTVKRLIVVAESE